MPPDMTACTIESGARVSAATCNSQAPTATAQPIANHLEANRPAALPSGCRTRTGGASTAPRCLSRKATLVARADPSASSSPRIMRAQWGLPGVRYRPQPSLLLEPSRFPALFHGSESIDRCSGREGGTSHVVLIVFSLIRRDGSPHRRRQRGRRLSSASTPSTATTTRPPGRSTGASPARSYRSRTARRGRLHGARHHPRRHLLTRATTSPTGKRASCSPAG